MESATECSVVTTPPFVSLMQAAGDVQVIVLPERSWLATVRLGMQLRGLTFDRVVDLQGNRASRLLTWVAGAKAERAGTWPGWPYTIAPAIPRYPQVHVENRLNQMAEILHLPGDAKTTITPAGAAPDRVRLWLDRHQLAGKKLVLMHAGCSQAWATKRWPASHFEAVAMHLRAAGYEMIWLGTKEEQSLNATLAASVGTDATNAFNLVELLALAAESCFALTNDSGPMHVLAAGGLPVYAFFGPVDSNRSHATGQCDRVFERELPCRPCYSKVCQLPGRTHECLAELLPDTVLVRLRLDGWLRD